MMSPLSAARTMNAAKGNAKRSGSGWRMSAAAVIGVLELTAASQGHAQAAPAAAPPPIDGAWRNKGLSPDERADAALKAMTLDEKLRLLRTPLSTVLAQDKREGMPASAAFIRGAPRLGLPAIAETDASLGVANGGAMRRGDVATALPSSLALGSAWDPDLAYRGGAMIGAEARAKGFGVMLGGGSNLIREPRGGRNFEYISEDPLLSGVLAGKAIAGIQSNHIVSTMKHFALNDQETGRDVYSADMAETPMRESDLLAFEIAVEVGQPGSVMCAYNRVNSVYACENPFLLSQVLRTDWGFKGFVMSDWGAVHSVGALQAGLDQESGYQIDARPYFGADLSKALADGQVPETAVDTAARRILRTLFAHGLMDDPPKVGGAIDYDADGIVAQDQAEAGIVLLRNEKGVLPLAAGAKRIAVIGGHADIGVLSGGGSSQVVPVGGVKLEVREHGPGMTQFIKRIYGGMAPLAALKAAVPASQVDYIDGADPAAAAALAAKADVAVVLAEKWSYESADSADMDLGAGQDALIEAVARANPKTVVVLETGNPVAMPWLGHVPAVLAAWYPGQRGGVAIARILTGAIDPSGHLPVTWPASIAQAPAPKLPGSDIPPPKADKTRMGMTVDKEPFAFSYKEGSDAGYRWYARTGARPLYPFGHGLSYTRFRYSGLSATGGKTITARFTVTNIGKRAGADVAQVYVVAPGHAKRLVGWGRPKLDSGQAGQVEVAVDPRLLADFDAKKQAWVIKPGSYRVEVAKTAVDPVLHTDLTLEAREIPVSAASRD